VQEFRTLRKIILFLPMAHQGPNYLNHPDFYFPGRFSSGNDREGYNPGC
jgi:hypothetical protein